MRTGGYRATFILVLLMLLAVDAKAQFNVQHQPPTVIEYESSATLDFIVPGINQFDIVDALLYYRFEGDLSYSQLEVPFVNGMFSILPIVEGGAPRIREQFGIYMPGSGRINIAGLPEDRLDEVAERIATIL